MKSPVITLAELNTVYKDLIDRINVASVYNFKGEITIPEMIQLSSDKMKDENGNFFVKVGDIFEIHDSKSDPISNYNDITNALNLQLHDNIVCKHDIDESLKTLILNNGGISTDPNNTYFWGNYWTEIGSYMQLADESHNGFVSTDNQKFKGNKEFIDNVTIGKTLTVNGSTSNTGNVTTSILNITGGESTVNTLTANKLEVNDTAIVQNIEGPNTTINVNAGGTTTVNTIDGIDGIGPNGSKDYADFRVNGTVTCKNFDLSSSDLTLNADTTVNSIQHESCILKPSGDVDCVNFIATDHNITANTEDSTIKQINNNKAVLNSSGTVSCINFDASNMSIVAQSANSIIKNVDTTSGVLSVLDLVKCSTFDATGMTIYANAADSVIKNISSTTATLNGISSIKCGALDTNGYKLTINDNTTFSSIDTSPILSTTGNLTCGDVTIKDTSDVMLGLTVNSDVTLSNILGSPSITTSGNITCKNFDNTTGTIKDINIDDTIFSSITGSGTLNVSGTLYCKDLYANDGTGVIKVPTVKMGNGSSSVPMSYIPSSSSSDQNTRKYSNSILIGEEGATGQSRGDLIVNGHIFAGKVHNAVWNDLVDCIPVNEDVQLEYGYCYSFDGEKYYKSNKHCDPQFIGIHSDTSGIRMGERPSKTLDAAISGFVLAYVDHYKSGTPLVCGKNGRLEKATIFDKIFKPYRIIATYWKDENEEEYGPKSDKVKVNGRNWIKIK